MQPISRSTLGLAAEYAVAAELCRRNVYAQLTLGNQKRTDILAFSEAGELVRLEVKGKQGGSWPSCRGVAGERTFLIFVDFEGRSVDARPDYYVLTPDDWLRVVAMRVEQLRASNPGKRVEVGDDNVPVFVDEITKEREARARGHGSCEVSPAVSREMGKGASCPRSRLNHVRWVAW